MRIGDPRATKIHVMASTKAQALVLFWRPRVSAPKPGRCLEPKIRPPEPVAVSSRQVLGGLREKKLFCPGNSFPCFRLSHSRINSRPAKSFSPSRQYHPRAVVRRHRFNRPERRNGADDQ